MKKDDKIIMFESNEAARLVTVKGWVSSNGRYYGDDERLARYDGSTHFKCECGGIAERVYTCCKDCRDKKDRERYFAMPSVPWPETEPVCLYDSDEYFFNEDDIEEYLKDNDLEPEDLMLVVCDPVHLRQVYEDNWQDELPEDGELPEEVEKALKALNEVIAKQAPTCYYPGKKRTTYIR